MDKLLNTLDALEIYPTFISWYGYVGCTLQFKYNGTFLNIRGQGKNKTEALFSAISRMPKAIRNFI